MAPTPQPKLEFITIVKATTIKGEIVEPGLILAVPGECPEADAKVLVGVGKALAGKKPEEAKTAKKQWDEKQASIASNDAARSGGGPNMVALIEEVRNLRAEVAELKASSAKGGK